MSTDNLKLQIGTLFEKCFDTFTLAPMGIKLNLGQNYDIYS